MPKKKPPISLFIIDDHYLIREALKCSLCPDFTVVGEAGTAAEAMEKIAAMESYPDIFLIDLYLPDIHGLILMHRIWRQCKRNCRIVIITANHHPTLRDRCLRAGAVGFVYKEQSIGDLAQTLRKAMKNTPIYSQKIHYRPVELDDDTQYSGLEVRLASLGDIELQIMLAITQGKSLNAIPTIIGISPSYLKLKRLELLKKMDCKTDIDLANAAVAMGLTELQPVMTQKHSDGFHITRMSDDIQPPSSS